MRCWHELIPIFPSVSLPGEALTGAAVSVFLSFSLQTQMLFLSLRISFSLQGGCSLYFASPLEKVPDWVLIMCGSLLPVGVCGGAETLRPSLEPSSVQSPSVAGAGDSSCLNGKLTSGKKEARRLPFSSCAQTGVTLMTERSRCLGGSAWHIMRCSSAVTRSLDFQFVCIRSEHPSESWSLCHL